jgi:voltage-gated potassium channel
MSSVIEYENTVIRSHEYSLNYLHVYKVDESMRERYGIRKKYIDYSKIAGKFCSYITFTCSIFLWITIYFDEVIFYQLVNNKPLKNLYVIFESKQKFCSFISFIIFYLLAPMPMTYGIDCHFHSEKYDYNYKVPLNSIFTAFCLIRLYFVVKYYLVKSNYYNQRAFRAFKIYGLDISLGFPFKSALLLYPLTIDLILFLIFLFLCSYNLRIFERYLDLKSGTEFGHFYNDLWCIFITMTTVGYGDLAPTTEFGRIFVLISCFFGTFLVALAVSSVSNCLLLENNEYTIFQILEKAISIEGKNEAELMMVMRYIKILKKLKKGKSDSKKKIESYQKKMALFLEKYKIAKDYYLETCASFNDFDELMNYLDYVENNIVALEEKINNIITIFDKVSPPSIKNEDEKSESKSSSNSSSQSSYSSYSNQNSSQQH